MPFVFIHYLFYIPISDVLFLPADKMNISDIYKCMVAVFYTEFNVPSMKMLYYSLRLKFSFKRLYCIKEVTDKKYIHTSDIIDGIECETGII